MFAKLRNAPVVRRFSKFVLIGLSCLVVDLVVLNVMLRVLSLSAGDVRINLWGVGELGINKYIAATVAFLCGAANGYFWNRLWTFREAPAKRVKVQFMQYVAVGVSGWLLSLLIMAVLVEGVGSRLDLNVLSALALRVSDVEMDAQLLYLNLVRLTAVAVVAIWDFTLQSVWTFAH